jgi:hypothetical protein
MRAGFAIPCPELIDVEGVVPRKDNRLDMGEGFACGVVGNAAVPVYGARWNLRYFLEKIPARPITPPPNPMLAALEPPGLIVIMFAPTPPKLVVIWEFMPTLIEMSEITEATPITMPSTASQLLRLR